MLVSGCWSLRGEAIPGLIITPAILSGVTLSLSLSRSFSLTETRDHRVFELFSAPSVRPDVIRTSRIQNPVSSTRYLGQYGTIIISKAFFIYVSSLCGLGSNEMEFEPYHMINRDRRKPR